MLCAQGQFLGKDRCSMAVFTISDRVLQLRNQARSVLKWEHALCVGPDVWLDMEDPRCVVEECGVRNVCQQKLALADIAGVNATI